MVSKNPYYKEFCDKDQYINKMCYIPRSIMTIMKFMEQGLNLYDKLSTPFLII